MLAKIFAICVIGLFIAIIIDVIVTVYIITQLWK